MRAERAVRYGIFEFDSSNIYPEDSALKVYKLRSAADKAVRKLDPDYSLNLVVREFEPSLGAR